MEPEILLIRIGYMILFITLSLMTWAYMVRAEAFPFQSSGPSMAKGQQGTILDDFPPCSFNTLCKCSNPGPSDFGIVSCHNIPFGNLPSNLRTSRAFVLSMVGNELEVLEDRQLTGSALWRLEIRKNKLNTVRNESLIGLEKSLWELDLQDNELTHIPTPALRKLTKLRLLDLSWNKITDIDEDAFQGLQNSLTCLSIAGNMIVYIPDGAFSSLTKLEKLDLSRNSIRVIDSSAFISNSLHLTHLYLSNNLFLKIPFEVLAPLSNLQLLDLSNNLITSTYDPLFYQGKITVGSLLLKENQIYALEPFAFQNIGGISILSLSGNPTSVVEEDAFKELRLKELDISHCFLTHIHARAFQGLQSSLETLDISFNNLSSIPLELFEGFDLLSTLSLDENPIIMGQTQLDHLKYSIQKISMVGDKVVAVPLQEIRAMRNLRKLNMSSLRTDSLTADTFDGFGPALEELRMSRSRLSSIKNNAFIHIPGVKVVDLSSNRITRIDPEAFIHVSHSLQKLRLGSALRMTTISPRVFEKLVKLQEVDLSGNGLTQVPEESFIKNEEITYLNLRFNKISSLSSHLLESLSHLHRIYVSFNALTSIQAETFYRFKDLELIQLNENQITQVEPRAFVDLTNLRILNLAGNSLTYLKDESFQNLPKLQTLDLSYNNLRTFNIDAFEQLGTLSYFKINLSHNKINDLLPKGYVKEIHETLVAGGVEGESMTTEIESEKDVPPQIHITPDNIPLSSSSIEEIDLSYNNISHIYPHFFTPLGDTVNKLDISHNRIMNLTRAQLDGMRYLQVLHAEHNLIETLDYDTFRNLQSLQMICLDFNSLRDITPDIFENLTSLRVFSARNNRIRALTESIFKDTQLEILDMANNALSRFPEKVLSRIAKTLVKLDLSYNEIASLNPTQLITLTKLRSLDLSNNRIVVIAETTFDTLRHLGTINLSGNPLGKIIPKWFEVIKENLLHLHISNTSLESLPDFDQFYMLKTFNASLNFLSYLPTNFGVNVSTLSVLDISNNLIPAPPNTIWHTIPRLSTIILHSNPIRVLSNDSFLQLDRLYELDVSNLPLEIIQIGTFISLDCLKELTIGPLISSVSVLSPSAYIQFVENLQFLHLKLSSSRLTTELKAHPLPWNLKNITISGPELMSIANGAFEGIQSRSLKLTLDDTGLPELSSGALQRIGSATSLTLSVTGNNSNLAIIGNPNTEYRPEPFSAFLRSLELSDELTIACSCDSGWIEFWLRYWMDQNCAITSVTPKEDSRECDEMLNSLRAIDCKDKPGTSLVEAFVTELECGWESSSSKLTLKIQILLTLQLFIALNLY